MINERKKKHVNENLSVWWNKRGIMIATNIGIILRVRFFKKDSVSSLTLIFRQGGSVVSYSYPVYFIIWPVLDVVLHFQSKQTFRNVLAQMLENKSKVWLVQLQGMVLKLLLIVIKWIVGQGDRLDVFATAVVCDPVSDFDLFHTVHLYGPHPMFTGPNAIARRGPVKGARWEATAN